MAKGLMTVQVDAVDRLEGAFGADKDILCNVGKLLMVAKMFVVPIAATANFAEVTI